MIGDTLMLVEFSPVLHLYDSVIEGKSTESSMELPLHTYFLSPVLILVVGIEYNVTVVDGMESLKLFSHR